ncbi:MAG TPA: YHYH protein [Caulobacteraceae bacterium]|jgi:hypothetical protein
MRTFLALLVALAAGPALAGGVDLHHLPLGDGKLSTAPKAGFIWACRVDPNAGGAQVDGPWIDKAAGTYDFTAKTVVQGHAVWTPDFHMSIVGDQRVFTTNDLPDHPTGTFPISPSDPAFQYDRNPNSIRTQKVTLSLPADPVLAAEPSCAPGAVGILLTGAVLFSALDAPGRDAVAHEAQDSCQGHPQEGGVYHYHSLSGCLEDKRLPDGHSALVGYAIDGFGIFGRYGEGGKLLTSADLDACHGHTHAIPWNGKMVVMYHYHATYDFPYTVGCLRGAYNMATVRAISGPPPTGRGPGGPGGGRPDLAAAAQKLGISEDSLRAALGPPPPDLAAAATKLGVTEAALKAALGVR